MGRLIAVANQKGGVGKTTTTINLAAALAVMEKKVLIVDCDAQANATSGSGANMESVKNTLYDVFFEPDLVHKSMIETTTPNLWLLPSSQDLVGVEIELVDKIGREYYLSEVMKRVVDEYDFIFFDCPPSLGLLTINALCAARELLVPLQCEYYALEGIVKLLQTFEQVKKRLNKEIVLLGVLLTMYDVRNKLSRQVKNEVRKCFPSHIFESVVPRNVRLSEAPSFGKSILGYDIKSKGAESYMSLAKEVILRNAETF